jgi:hypothetical protein
MTEQPTIPPRPGYYWEYTEGLGWREVRPMNWAILRQYQLRKVKERRQ